MTKNTTALFTTIAFWTPRLSLSVLLLGSLCRPSNAEVKKVEIVDKPIVNDERVTIRVKATDANERPNLFLQDTDFKLIVDGKPLEFRSKDWKSPEDSIPPPAFIIVLLDYSGSMNQPDSSGKTKIEGAMDAIRQFTNELANRCPKNSDTCPKPQVSIVPFGESGPKCATGYPVDNTALDKFFSAGSFQLYNYLDYLAKQEPCASTNIYDPITQALRFLSNDQDSRFYVPKDSNLPQPKLSIILLSDGYHNKSNEERDFNNLLARLKKNDQITVHTLGYGLTPEELGKKYKLERPATRQDIGTGEGKVPEQEFVDKSRLEEIAKTTGGISEFSADSRAVSEKLKLFMNSLLGEYQISYTEPNAERGSKHNVKVEVASIESQEKPYTITAFGRSLPFPTRIIMILFVLILMGGGWALPFWFWGENLKREAEI